MWPVKKQCYLQCQSGSEFKYYILTEKLLRVQENFQNEEN